MQDNISWKRLADEAEDNQGKLDKRGNVVYEGELNKQSIFLNKSSRQKQIQDKHDQIKSFMNVSKEDEIAFFLNLGYLSGNTAYDFHHHTSELEYPMDNWLLGTGMGFNPNRNNWSFELNIWTELEKYAGDDMKDKDWDGSGNLWSYTESETDMKALILDILARYDFYKHKTQDDELRLGFLIGYQYEELDYVMKGAYYVVDTVGGHQGQTLYEGEPVLEYNIKYSLPYIGLAADYQKKRWGLGMDVKWSYLAQAEDIDHHIYPGVPGYSLHFYGDYDENADVWLASLNGFWEFAQYWRFKAGLDAAMLRIDGKTWSSDGNPAWSGHQSTDARQFLTWAGIEYRF